MNIFPHTFFAGACYTYSIAQYIFTALSSLTVTFNRFHCIKYPLNYKFLWSGWKLVLFAIWPLAISLPILFFFITEKVDYIEDDIGRLTLIYVNDHTSLILWNSLIYSHLVVLVVNSILNILLIRACRSESKKNAKRNKEFKLELIIARLALVYFIVFFILFITELAMTVALYGGFENLANDTLSAMPFCESLIVFTPLYSLLFLSDDLRTQYLLSFNIKILNNYLHKNVKHEVTTTLRSNNNNVITTKVNNYM
uniref:Serpentine receptor class gamma n=1 Tax=Parastrongyloides trichosuri TaxID=131310 RepID=A0A0N4ZXI9_PARTI